jgi:hypothetical protein
MIFHIYTLSGLGTAWESAMIAAMTFPRYLLVIAALFLSLKRGTKKRPVKKNYTLEKTTSHWAFVYR